MTSRTAGRDSRPGPGRTTRSTSPRARRAKVEGEFARGAEAAADLASQYDKSSAHDHRLGDCILAKLNLRSGRPRKNKDRLPDPDHAWTRGFAAALADVYRLLAGGHEPRGICRIAAAAGVNLLVMRKAKVSAFDMRTLQRAGVP